MTLEEQVNMLVDMHHNVTQLEKEVGSLRPFVKIRLNIEIVLLELGHSLKGIPNKTKRV